jgi:hypothetical protein
MSRPRVVVTGRLDPTGLGPRRATSLTVAGEVPRVLRGEPPRFPVPA